MYHLLSRGYYGFFGDLPNSLGCSVLNGILYNLLYGNSPKLPSDKGNERCYLAIEVIFVYWVIDIYIVVVTTAFNWVNLQEASKGWDVKTRYILVAMIASPGSDCNDKPRGRCSFIFSLAFALSV